MADYETRTTVVTHHDFVIPTREPWGAAVAEFGKAHAAARQKYEEIHGKAPQYDDWARVHAEDDAVVIRVTEEARRG